MKLELKSNAIYIHYNLGGATNGHLGLLMTENKYDTLSPVPYILPVRPGILLTPNNATHAALYKLK